MALKTRLASVTERPVLFQILKHVENEPDGNVVQVFCESLDLFGKFLTPIELSTKIEPILLAQNPLRASISYSKCLTTIKESTFRDIMTVLEWLKSTVERHLQGAIEESLKVGNEDFETLQLYREFTVACVNLPEKISNCRARARTEEQSTYITTILHFYKNHLLHDLQSALLTAHSSPSPNLKTLAELISAGRNLEISENCRLLQKMIEWIGKIENFDKKWQKIMLEMFDKPTVFGTQVHEQLLTSLFLSVDREEQLKRCLPVNNITGTLKRVVLVKLPFQRILEPWTVKLLVDFVIRTREASAHGLLETALKLWSDINYVQKTQEAQERHLVRLILYLIHRLQNQSIIPWNDFFLHASNGVYTRLQMLPVFIRTALFLNETLSGLATKFTENAPEAPKIDIDDSPQQCEETESEWNEEMRHIFKNGIMTSQTSRAETMCIEAPKSSRRAEKVTKKALDSDDDDGEDEDFPTYTVDAAEKEFRKLEAGEEPKKAVKPPDYIQDAFEQLLEREKYEIFEAAFFTLPSLIRRRAVGFSSIAEQLVLRVVHLQDHFNTRQFHETVEEIATATIAQRPQIVPNLVRIIIAPGQAERIQQRLLHFIHKAADEMGSLDQKQAKFVENQQKKLERVHAGFGGTVPEWKKEVEARIASKTRIISRGVQEKVGVKNRLAENAKYMFYPLLVMPRGDMARLLNRDSDLLSLIIMVASMIFVRCGICPTVGRMATELIAYVRPHRYSENPKVRGACLAAHLNVVALLPKELSIQLFSVEERQEWVDWAGHVATSVQSLQVEHDLAAQLISMIVEQDQED